MCVDYEGDCSGTISGDEEKLCTIKNYIVGGIITPPIEIDDTTELSPLDTSLQIQNSINDIEDKSSLEQFVLSIPF